MTPYRSGFPIDSIPPVDQLDPDIPRQRQVYQIIVGWINWLAICTHPDISPALTFLASYSNAPHPQHYKAAFHTLKYLMSKINMEYLSTPSPPQHYKPSTISHIITIRRHKQKRRRLNHQDITNSQPFLTPTGLVNSVVKSKKALLLNYSNFSLSLVFSSSALTAKLHENQLVKIPQLLWNQNQRHQRVHHRTTTPE